MNRYLIERTVPNGLTIPMTGEGRTTCASVLVVNETEGVSWVHSYVSADRKKTFCIYDAPSPDAIRKVAERNGLPVDTITQVSVLDPYFYLAG